RSVIIRPHVVAFVNRELLCPLCSDQFPKPILSLIKASRVAWSGTLNKASAKHIKATPSSVDKEYSCNKFCTSPSLKELFFLWRKPCTKATACSAIFG